MANTSKNEPVKGQLSLNYRHVLRAKQRAGEKNEISAGFQNPARDHMDRDLCLDEYLIRNPNATYYLRAEGGHGLSGEGKNHPAAPIQDGDLMIVDRAKAPAHSNMVIASVSDDLRVYRFVTSPHGDAVEQTDGKKLWLRDQSDIQIWGVINYVIHSV
jgi:DNA polymerase V